MSSQRFAATFPAEPTAVSPARRAILAQIRDRADAEVLDDVGLAVSEACTNAVLHAYRLDEPGTFDVAASVEDGLLRVVVSDSGNGMAERDDSPGLGMGLKIMRMVADSLDVTSDGPGTALAMTFRLRRPPTRL